MQVRKFSRAQAGAVAAALLAMLASVPAHAAIDVTAVTTGVNDAQTAVLAVITALMGLSVAIFGIAKVYAFIKRKAGA